MPLHSAVDFHPTWGNLWAPPLLFRRRPPQSNCPPSTVSEATHLRLESQYCVVGIPPTTHVNLAAYNQSLPTILYTQHQDPIPSYSKAPWGLSVLLQVMGIFTHNTTSPGLPPRQHSNRYTIRAGRNLPDKEFRYLRTVIVTAAVHRGFNSELSLLLLTFRHWAGVSPYTSPFSLA